MLSNKEVAIIIGVSVVLAFSISLVESFKAFLYALVAVFFVIMINTFSKKVSGFHLDSEVEVGLWEIKRYGFRPEQYFKKPFPAGAFFPVISKILSAGYVTWMASFVFEVKPKIYRAAKRHGIYRFSEMTEYHLALIAAAGIFSNLFLAAIGYLIGFPNFSKLNIYYAFFNMIPLSDLDGNKIFFGSLALWSFLEAVVLVAVAYSFLIV